MNIEEYFSIAHESTKETRLRLLHFKFIHNIYPTNILLSKMGIMPSNKCIWCSEIDCIEYAFFKCTKLEKFWKSVQQLILAKHGSKHIGINEKIALFGVTKTKIVNAEMRKT